MICPQKGRAKKLLPLIFVLRVSKVQNLLLVFFFLCQFSEVQIRFWCFSRRKSGNILWHVECAILWVSGSSLIHMNMLHSSLLGCLSWILSGHQQSGTFGSNYV